MPILNTKEASKAYFREAFKYTVAVYAVYAAIVALYLRWSDIKNWVSSKIDGLKSKFRKEAEPDLEDFDF